MKLTEAHAALGVTNDTPLETVRQAYKRLALRYHPDKNPSADATATFQRISAAYKKIADHRTRQTSHDNQEWEDDDEDGGGFGHDSDDDLDDMDMSVEEMMMMFQMLFGPSKQPSRKPRRRGQATARRSRFPPAAAGPLHSSMFADPEMMLFDQMFGDMSEFEDELLEMADFFHMAAAYADDLEDECCSSSDSECEACDATETTAEHANNEPQQTAVPVSNGAPSAIKSDQPAITVNARVRVLDKHLGVVKFVGPVHYSKGDFLGVELDEPLGKNNGTIKGVSYFECADNRGLMVRVVDATVVA